MISPTPKLAPTNRKSFFDSPWCGFVWLGISLLVCLLFAWSVSPLYVNEGGDSALFKIIGQGILNGKLPYRDLFDHKGPVIFYLNACGLGLAGGKVGLLVLNALVLTATLCLVYRISRLFSSAKKNRWLYFVFVPVAVLSFFLLGKRLYSHYFLVFLPFFSLCISLVRNKYYLVTIFCATLGGFGGSAGPIPRSASLNCISFAGWSPNFRYLCRFCY